ncbi:pyridoxal phosphate-dependent decarboxylase family protein [Lysobacter sp. CA199]|uniref:pyridoxal phosphate-dependent decarboxylase family protein n=1 Tax=Lysobacter sp. CA199 TaxID=3455608 RepID=UPI003F8D5EA5
MPCAFASSRLRVSRPPRRCATVSRSPLPFPFPAYETAPMMSTLNVPLNVPGRKTLPARGRPWSELQEALTDLRSDDADWRHGRGSLHVYYAGEDVLDVARRAYSMFISENALAPTMFPSLRKMQDDLVQISLSLLGGGRDACGTVTSGGSESVMLAVRSAYRAFRAKRPQVRRPHLLLPASAHPAYDQAAEVMGLDVIRVAIGGDYRANVQALAQCVEHETMMIVASAPSLPFGMIDPIEELARIAREHEVWLHVDACIGGFLAPHVARFMTGVPRFDLGIAGVRSLSADLHKFGYAANGASVVLYADAEDQAHQFFEYSDWPKGLYRTETLSGTLPGGAVAAAWAVMHYLGGNRLSHPGAAGHASARPLHRRHRTHSGPARARRAASERDRVRLRRVRHPRRRRCDAATRLAYQPPDSSGRAAHDRHPGARSGRGCVSGRFGALRATPVLRWLCCAPSPACGRGPG